MSKTISDKDFNTLHKILDSRNGMDAYMFCKTVSGADTELLQKIAIDSGDPEVAFMFARDIEGADIDKLQDAVIHGRDAWIAYRFAKHIPDADVSAMQKVVMDSVECQDMLMLLMFAQDIPEANTYMLRSRLADMARSTGDNSYLQEFDSDPIIQSKRAALKPSKIGRPS